MVTLQEIRARRLQPGKEIAGRYTLLNFVGRGGFGQVWRATDQRTNHVVALKLLGEHASVDEITRFKREFAVLTELAHPHINPVYDLLTDPIHGHFFTSAFVEGVPITTAAAQSSIVQIEDLAVHTLRALEYLRRRGVLHRDLKPANLLVSAPATPQQHVHVIDFGLAALRQDAELAGTPSFMAPELFLGEPADARTDLYGFGVVLYVCLTRQNPFRAVDMDDARQQHLHVQPPPPSVWNPRVPEYLDVFLSRLLAKIPSDRYANAGHALRELLALSPHPHRVEDEATALSYVPSGALFVGRDAARASAQQWLEGAAGPLCVVDGGRGMGKTALLQLIKREAQLRDLAVTELWGEEDPHLETGLEQLATLIGGAGSTARTIIVIDDLDRLLAAPPLPAVATIIESLLDRLAQPSASPLFLCCSLRKRPPRLNAWSGPVQTIALAPLSIDETAGFLDAIATVPPTVRIRLATALQRRSGGCPAILTHLLRTLIQQGQLVDAGGAWDTSQFEDLPLDLGGTELPARMVEEMEQVLAGLAPPARALLEWLALCETPLAGSAFVALCDHEQMGSPGGAMPGALPALVTEGWIIHDVRADTYTIPDAVLGETLRMHLTPEERARRHTVLAEVLRAHGAPPTVVDQHGAYSTAADAPSAFLRLCAQEQREGRLLQVMRRVKERLIEMANTTRPTKTATTLFRVDLLLQLARVQFQADLLEASETTIQETLALVPDCSDPRYFEAAEHLGALYQRAGRWDDAATHLEAVYTQTHGHAVWRLRLRNMMARIHLMQHRLTEARAIYEEARAVQAQLTHDERRQVVNNELGHCALLQQQYDLAAQYAREELQAVDPEAAPLQAAIRHHVLATALQKRGETKEALQHYELGIALARQAQDLRLLVTLYNGLGNLWAESRTATEAIPWLERALPLCYRIGDLAAAVVIGLNLGQLRARQQENAAAEAGLRAALACTDNEKFRGHPTNQWRCRIHQLLGELARRRGAWAEADQALDQAWHAAQADGLTECYSAILVTQAQVAADQGKLARARSHLQTAAPYPRSPLETAEYQRLQALVCGGAA